MPKNDGTMEKIVGTCLEIDLMAVKVYRKFMDVPVGEPIQSLFQTMYQDETRHVAYWRGLLERSQHSGISDIFEAPDKILFELGGVADAALSFQHDLIAHTPRDPHEMILRMIRMEYALLQPSFLALFGFADILPGRRTMEEEYEDHMQHICGALNAQAGENPMFPLFGELLRRVWHETKRLVTLNQSDTLSGVLNRRGFHAQIRPMLFLSLRKRFPVALMLIDIDLFKNINDSHGHQAGDKVIRQVALSVRDSVRQSDVVARYGGDEFIVFLFDVRAGGLAEMARKIKAALEKGAESVAPVTVSIGIASLIPGDDADRTLERLLLEADAALYEVKAAGRNGFRLREL
jgi:diguanylate cyclase (GGDEF)-like protein